METAIGVFSTRDRAEEAVQELLTANVPPDSIVLLSRSGEGAAQAGNETGATVGGFMGVATGMSAGVGAALLMAVPGIGQVFALGFGAAALLGLAGAEAGSAIGKSAADSDVQPVLEEKSSEEIDFFRKVLAAGRSLVVVKSKSPEMGKIAHEILTRRGANAEEGFRQDADGNQQLR